MRTVAFDAVIKPSRFYYKHPVLARATRKTPKLLPGQIAVNIRLELPDDWDVPTTFPLTIAENQIQRPTAKAI